MLALLEAHNATQNKPAWPMQIEGVIPVGRTFSDPSENIDEYVYWAN